MIKVGGFEIGKFPDGTPMIKERYLTNTEQEDDVLNFPYRRIYWLYESMDEFPTLCMVAEHLREHGYEVSLHMPYIPNARMDRVHDGDVFTLKYFCKMLNTIGFNQVHTLDAHSNVSIALIDRCKNHNPSIFIQQAVDKFNPDIIYFPDAGAMKRYQDIIAAYKFPLIYGEKQREWETGKILGLALNGVEAAKAKLNIEKPKVLMIDDICAFGGTMYYSAKALKDAGMGDIAMYVTHCENSIFDRDKSKILSDEGRQLISHVYTTESMPLHQKDDKITVLEGIYDRW